MDSKAETFTGKLSTVKQLYGWIASEIWLLPNIISITRILLILPIAILYPLESATAFWWMMAILIISYVSDFADGFAARRLNLTSRLGLFLDPGADKIWTVAMIILLIIYRDLNPWIAGVIIGRDFAIFIMNYRFRYIPGLVMEPTWLGKFYMVLTGALIIGMSAGLARMNEFSLVILVLSILTFRSYFIRYRRVFDKHGAVRKILP